MTTGRDHVTAFYYGTFLPAANGSHARVVPMLDRLAAEFERVILYTYANHPQCPWDHASEAAFRARWPRIELVIEPYTSKLRYATRAKNLLISLFPGLANRLIRFAVPGGSPLFDDVKARTGVFIVSYTEGLAQLNGIDPADCYVETHDVNFVKWSKLALRSPVSLVPLRKLRGEVGALENVRGVIAISPSETSFFRMMLTSPTVSYVPAWEAPGSVLAGPDVPEDFDLAFAGSEYTMNVRGLCGLLETHGDWLSRYRIAVCGNVCRDPAVIAAAARHPNVTLLGFVDRVEDVYARSRAALAPVDGTGMKMKIVSALAVGRPVFASTQSLEGLPPGYQGAVFEISQAQVDGVLGSESRLHDAKANALRYHAQLVASGDVLPLLSAIRGLVPANGPPAGGQSASGALAG